MWVRAVYHGDLIDSTMLTTDEGGTAVSAVSYTGFGELVTPDGQGGWIIGGTAPEGFPRYQYAGGWGYETGLPTEDFPYSDLIALWGANPDLPAIVLLHVGARWYDPAGLRAIQDDWGPLPGAIVDPIERAGVSWGAGAALTIFGGTAATVLCVGPAAGASGVAGRQVVTYVVKTRATAGADGAISQIIKKYVNGVLVEVRHVVIRAGRVIHDHVKWRR